MGGACSAISADTTPAPDTTLVSGPGEDLYALCCTSIIKAATDDHTDTQGIEKPRSNETTNRNSRLGTSSRHGD